MEPNLGYRKKMAKSLAISNGISMAAASRMIEKTLNMISEALIKEGRIELRNFGIFECVVKAPRKCRNPKTGVVVFVPKKYKIKFKPGKQMMIKITEENIKKETDIK